MWLFSYLVHTLIFHLAVLYNAMSHPLLVQNSVFFKISLHQDASGDDSDLRVLLENHIHQTLYLYPEEVSNSVSAVEVPVSILLSCNRQAEYYPLLWVTLVGCNTVFHLFQILYTCTWVHRLFLGTPGGPCQMQEKPIIKYYMMWSIHQRKDYLWWDLTSLFLILGTLSVENMQRLHMTYCLLLSE